MVEQIKNIEDLKSKVLDKPDTNLSQNEIKVLNSLGKNIYKSMDKEIEQQKFDLKDINGKELKGVSLKDLVENIDTQTNISKVNGNQIKIGWGTELGAWIQVYLISHPEISVVMTDQAKGEYLGIDGKIGRFTKGALDELKGRVIAQTNIEKNPDFPKVGFDQIKTHPFKAYFLKLFGTKVTEEYQNKYKLFNGSKFTYITYDEAKDVGGYINFGYDGTVSKGMPSRTIYANDVKNKDDGTIDIPKFLKAVKSKIDTEEQYRKNILLEKENRKLGKEVIEGINNMQLKDFSSLIQAYIKAQNRVLNGNLYLPRDSMMVSGKYLRVLIPGEKRANHVTLQSLKSSDKFDEKKLINLLSSILNPLAKKWKDSLEE